MRGVRRMTAAAVLAAAVAGVPLRSAFGQIKPESQPAATAPAGQGQQDVPVKVVVLFSSGVGYFEHAGTIKGNASTELRFKTNQINDILKSLLLQDLGGGKVTTVVYPSQDPIEKTLRSFQVDITGNPQVQAVVIKAWNAGVIVSAVCHGPSAFLGVKLDDGSPLVRGRKLTSFSKAEEDGYARDDVPFDLETALREEGAEFEATDPWQPKLVVDGRLITGQNPASGGLVGAAVAKALLK